MGTTRIEFVPLMMSMRYADTTIAGLLGHTQQGVTSRYIHAVDDEKFFQIMDAVANTVSDTVEPQIVPNIMLETVNGKSLVVVEIEAGENRPYYIKSERRDKGTYVRVGATSRPADPTQIKELEIEGKNLSWDKLRCIGCPVDEAAPVATNARKMGSEINFTSRAPYPILYFPKTNRTEKRV